VSGERKGKERKVSGERKGKEGVRRKERKGRCQEKGKCQEKNAKRKIPREKCQEKLLGK